MSQYYKQFVATLDKWLHSPGRVSDLADKIEKTTGVKRVYIGQGMFTLHIAVLLILLLCHSIVSLQASWVCSQFI